MKIWSLVAPINGGEAKAGQARTERKLAMTTHYLDDDDPIDPNLFTILLIARTALVAVAKLQAPGNDTAALTALRQKIIDEIADMRMPESLEQRGYRDVLFENVLRLLPISTDSATTN